MADLRSALSACGFDPSYERITVEALKRRWNVDGRQLEVDITKRTGEHLDIVGLSGNELGVITDVINQISVPYQDRVEILGQRVAAILIERLTDQLGKVKNLDPVLYAAISREDQTILHI